MARSLPLSEVYSGGSLGCTRTWTAGDRPPGIPVTDESLCPAPVAITAPPSPSSGGGGGGSGGGGGGGNRGDVTYRPGDPNDNAPASAEGIRRVVNSKNPVVTSSPEEHAARSGVPAIDIWAPKGSPVCTIEGGVVKSVRNRSGYGLTVEVDHGDGRTSLYAHLDSAAVKPGQRVSPQQSLGGMGNSGRTIGRTGVHVHMECKINGQYCDPRDVMRGNWRVYRK